MKILFVYVNTGMRASYPIGLTNLASYIKSLGHEVEIFDSTFYKQFLQLKRDGIREKIGMYKSVVNPVERFYIDSDLVSDLFKKISSFKPDIVGFSVLSAQFYFTINLSRKIKETYPDLPIIFGGMHPSLCPEETISESSIDMLCIGEGEYAIEELLECMKKKKNISGIKNLWVKEANKIHRNGIRELIDLDKLPVLDWSLFSEQHIYSPLNGRMRRVGSVEFSRGCPYSCAYCSCTALRNLTAPQKYLRHKSIDKAISDLAVLRDRYKVEMFYFVDESFLSVSLEVLKEFAQKYKKAVNVPFYGMTHPNSVTEEKVKIIEDMGCYLMTIGIEVGNEKFREETLSRPVKNKKIIEAFEIFRKSKVLPSAFAMIGMPFETRELVFETIDLVRRCKPETYSVGIFKPFIGSKLRKICIEKGFFDPAGDDYNYPNDISSLKMPQFSHENIGKLYKTFVLYTKVDKEDYPLVKKAETDDQLLVELVKKYSTKENNDAK